MQEKEIEIFCPPSQQDWRQWLQENYTVRQSVWLVQYKKNSGKPSISWSDAVDEALCFGWIDSTRRSVDNEKFMQLFTRRKLSSAWSKINKEKVQRLIDQGLMAPAGFASIEAAKQNGSWTISDDVEALIIPSDLQKAFNVYEGSNEYFP